MATPPAPRSTAPAPAARAHRGRKRRRALRRLAWLAVLALGLLALLYGDMLSRYVHTGTAYGARAGCACRYVQGRALGTCRNDFEPGMGLVTLSDDPATRSITARFVLLAPTRATFVEGAGCQLEPWVRR